MTVRTAHARHVVLAAVRQLERLDRARGGLADHVELALERVRNDQFRPAADEDLAQHRLLGAAPPATSASRHRPARRASREPTWPSARTARSSACTQASREACSFGRNTMPTPYSPGGGKRDAEPSPSRRGRTRRESGSGCRRHRPSADRRRPRRDGPGSRESSGPADDAVRLMARDVGDEADAAGVVLVRGRHTGRSWRRRQSRLATQAPTVAPQIWLDSWLSLPTGCYPREYRSAANTAGSPE